MKKFEYKIVYGSGIKEEVLNLAGQDGWELVSITQHKVLHLETYYFKRECQLEK